MIKTLSIFCLFVGVVRSQLNFGGDTSEPSPTTLEITERGLLADKLNKHPTGQSSGSDKRARFCCCISSRFRCPNPGNSGGGGGSFPDFINPRDSLNKDGKNDEPIDVSIRIQNDPAKNGQSSSSYKRCNIDQRTCCYQSFRDLSKVGNTCRPPRDSHSVIQRCEEIGQPRCGRRNPDDRVLVQGAEAKPNEFPWTCLILKGNNDFVGTCAIVPRTRDNRVTSGTDRVITAAHKLKRVGPRDLLKVRILEYDARGFNQGIEGRRHLEYEVVGFRNHPQYDDKRLSHDLSVIFLNTTIKLINNPGVSAACFPTCRQMFSPGSRCWVAGWGKDRFGTEGEFQFLQNKVDLPLVDDRSCENSLRNELRQVGAPDFRNFRLSSSEICAGGEKGKDACTGDGGAPLVCEGNSGSWYVVGLVTWGVKCGQEGVPAAYADVYDMMDFITQRSSFG